MQTLRKQRNGRKMDQNHLRQSEYFTSSIPVDVLKSRNRKIVILALHTMQYISLLNEIKNRNITKENK